MKIVPTHDAHADAAAGPLRVLVAVREGLLQASLSFLLTGPRSDDGGAAAGHHRRMLDSLTRIRARSGLVPLLAGVLALQACGGSDAPGAPVPPSNASATVQEQFNDVIRRVSPQVVQIETGSGLGSGVVYDRQGDIVTNAHVVGNAQRFLVTLHGGERHQATLVGTDPGNDLAVIRLSGATPTAATFADSAGVQSGDIGFAIGSDTVRIVADDLIGGRA